MGQPLAGLSRWLTLKIVLTICCWCLPMLCIPASVLATLGFPVPEPMLFLRLLGMAYGALVVGYAFGLASARRGSYPAAIVWMGIVSNGGASVVLAVHAAMGTWNAWSTVARLSMWGSFAAASCITIGLLMTGPMSRAGR